MSSRPRRINEMQADASRRRLEAIFGDIGKEKLETKKIAGRQPSDNRQTEDNAATLPQPASEKQGGCDA